MTADSSLTRPTLDIATDFRDLIVKTASCKVVMVDIPIGLPHGVEPRPCDLEARRVLVGAESRVFRAPPRQCLTAKNPREMQRIHRQLTGKGAGLPVWGIVPKLKDVHFVMRQRNQDRILEFHPELAWMRVAGQILPSKHGPEGASARTNILRKRLPAIDSLLHPRRFLRQDVKDDDILDACVGLLLAKDILDGTARRLPARPDEPPKDRAGLRMEIWY